MSQHNKHVAGRYEWRPAGPATYPATTPGKHRGAPERVLSDTSRQVVRSTVILSTLAATATGAAVVTGLAGSSDGLVPSAGHGVDVADGPFHAADPAAKVATLGGIGGVATPNASQLNDELARRAASVSRSFVRSARSTSVDPVKAAALGAVTASKPAQSHTENLADQDPRSIGRALLSSFGWGDDQFGCLDSLWTRESNWNPAAENSGSGAFGIPQSLPGSKMASAGSDWATNPVTQIKWGLGYIQERYGSPCGAWGHSESNGWY